jgi:hypothetical protein
MLNTRRTLATLAAAACLGVGGWALAGGTAGDSTTTTAPTGSKAPRAGHAPASADE